MAELLREELLGTQAHPGSGRAGRTWYSLGALLLAAAVAKVPLSGLDIWWHLRTGEALVHQPGWLSADPFSWTAAGQSWAYKDIAADVLLYTSRRLLGDAALSLWPALCVLALAAALWRARPREDGAPPTWPWALLLLAGVVAASQHRLHARPMLLSHAAFAWLLVALPRLHQPSRRARRQVGAAVVALLWAWAWLHRGVLVGVVTVWAWTAALWIAALVQRLRQSRQSRQNPVNPSFLQPSDSAATSAASAITLTWVAVVGSAVIFATPNGLALLTTVVAALGRRDYVDAVAEWAPIPALTLLREHGSWLLALVAAAVGVARPGRRDGPGLIAAVLLCLALGLSAVALGASRWIPYAALASAFAAGHAWSVLGGDRPALSGREAGPEAGPETGRILSHPRAIRLALLLTLACLGWVAARGGWAAPGTLARGRFPTAALAFARAHHLPPRLHNAYDFGGYVLWAGRGGDAPLRPEIDGRADMVYGPAQFRTILASHGDPRAFAARRAAKAADGAPPPTWVLGKNRPGDAAFAFLPHQRGWCLAFWSTAARIWLQRDAHAALCKRVGYEVFTGPALDAAAFRVGRSRDPARLLRARGELARMVAQSPQDVRPAVAAVVLAHGIGDRTKRDYLLAKLVARFGDDPAVLALLRRLAP